MVRTNQISGKGCKLGLVVHFPKPAEKGPSNVTSELDLADFDPRVKVDSDEDQNQFQVTFERFDAQMKTHEVNEYSDGRKLEMWTAEAYLFFDSEESAQRFAKAMSHAIALCGGRTAPF